MAIPGPASFLLLELPPNSLIYREYPVDIYLETLKQWYGEMHVDISLQSHPNVQIFSKIPFVIKREQGASKKRKTPTHDVSASDGEEYEAQDHGAPSSKRRMLENDNSGSSSTPSSFSQITSDISSALMTKCPLHIFAMTEHSGIVRQLLKAKLSVAARLSNGATPLHFAAFGGSSEVFEILLTAQGGMSALEMRDCNGHTPAGVAERYNHRHVLDLIEYYKRKWDTVFFDDLAPRILEHCDFATAKRFLLTRRAWGNGLIAPTQSSYDNLASPDLEACYIIAANRPTQALLPTIESLLHEGKVVFLDIETADSRFAAPLINSLLSSIPKEKRFRLKLSNFVGFGPSLFYSDGWDFRHAHSATIATRKFPEFPRLFPKFLAHLHTLKLQVQHFRPELQEWLAQMELLEFSLLHTLVLEGSFSSLDQVVAIVSRAPVLESLTIIIDQNPRSPLAESPLPQTLQTPSLLRLRSLSIDGPHVSSTCLNWVPKCTKLSSLSVKETKQLTLPNTLANATSLTHLCIRSSRGRILDDNCPLRSLLPYLTDATSLILDAPIRGRDLPALFSLCERLPSLATLHLKVDYEPSGKSDMAIAKVLEDRLQRMTQLRDIDFFPPMAWQSIPRASDCSFFLGLTHLERIGPKLMSHLALAPEIIKTLPKLRAIYLPEPKFDSALFTMAKVMHRLGKLTEMSLAVTQVGFLSKVLDRCTALENLHLRFSDAPETDVIPNSAPVGISLSSLSRLTRLKSLEINQGRIDPTRFDVLHTLSHLHKLELSFNLSNFSSEKASRFCDAIGNAHSVRSLSLRNTSQNVDDATSRSFALHISSAVSKMPLLLRVQVSSIKCWDQTSVVALGSALASLPLLESLDLFECGFGVNVNHVLEPLASRENINEVYLTRCFPSDVNVSNPVADLISKSDSISKLSLVPSYLNDAGAKVIALALRESRGLESFAITGHNISLPMMEKLEESAVLPDRRIYIVT